LADALRTHDGFVASVDARGGFNPFAIVPIGAGAMLMVVVYNLNKPYPQRGEPPVPLWKALFWCGPFDEGPHISTILMSWLALAMIIGGALWILRRRLTVTRDTEQLYQRYLQSGFLVELVRTNIVVSHGRTLLPLFLFGLPTTSPEATMAALATLQARLKANRLFVFKLSRLTSGGQLRGSALSLADAALPTDVFAATMIGFQPPDRPRIGVRDGDRVRLYPLKRDVSTM